MTTTHRAPAPFVRPASAILALAALFIAMLVTASPASAHARLEVSSPKDGSTLTATPPEVMLRFNEPIKEGLNQITVTSGSTDATDGKLEVDGNTVYQPLKSSLEAGSYTVTYKVVSADGHPVSGSLKFTYDPPTGNDGATEPTSSGDSSTGDSSTSASEGSATAPPASSSSSDAASTSAPTSTSPDATPSSTSATDGETQPSAPAATSSSPSTPAPASGDQGSSDGGVPTWVWIAGLGALAIILAGIGLMVRGRRDPEDEDIDLQEWRD